MFPQASNTTYFLQAPVGAYVAPLPAVRARQDGSLGKVLGSFLMTSPLTDAAKAVQGLGAETSENTGTTLPGGFVLAPAAIAVILVGRMVIGGIASYQIGKAVAPSASKQKKYAMWAIPIGLISPYVGLGAMAMYAMNKKG